MPFKEPPDPGSADTIDTLVERLRLLKIWAGDPSYEWIKDQITIAWGTGGRPAAELPGKTTVVDCFRPGRRRLNTDLVVAVVQALHPDVGYVTQWRQALGLIGGQREAAMQVRVSDALPEDLAGFTGRGPELGRLRDARERARADGGTVVITAIGGMAGVGKTRLAIHAGHLLVRENAVDRVLFVDLRGFHPDPAQPPADPAAVLDGFLRLLGVPGQQIPHDLRGRTAAYRERLAGSRTLVVLDNAADEEQVRPLLPDRPGCLSLVTSRRHLGGLRAATQLAVDAFTPDEALDLLKRSAPEIEAGADPDAAARIAHRCGYLPLALGLVAGHIRATPGWTLTDHADRLDERHRDRRLDTGVQLALDLSYRHLPAGQQRLLRLAALHPGHDLDGYAAAALADTDLSAAEAALHDLCRDHLLQRAAPGRYTLHDLVRAYAADLAADEDPPRHRHAALTRLFDHYLAAGAAAMDTLYPVEAHQRPSVAAPRTGTPDLHDPGAALGWLDVERATLVAVAAYTAGHGWPTHTTRLSTILYRYLDGGHSTDARAIHGHAHHAALDTSDPVGQAHALNGLGTVHLRLGRYKPAAEHLGRALHLFEQAGDRVGQARVLGNLGNVEKRLGRYRPAIEHQLRAMELFRLTGDRAGEARTLSNLGVVETRTGRYESATAHLCEALVLCRQIGDQTGEADTLKNLGAVQAQLDRLGPAATAYEQAIAIYRQLGDHASAAATLDDLGIVHTRLGQSGRATEDHQEALDVFRENGDRDGETWALNGLGEAAHAAGRHAAALTHHRSAYAIAVDIGSRDQQARAHHGLGRAHQARHGPDAARQHFRDALALFTELGMPDADRVRADLSTLDEGVP